MWAVAFTTIACALALFSRGRERAILVTIALLSGAVLIAFSLSSSWSQVYLALIAGWLFAAAAAAQAAVAGWGSGRALQRWRKGASTAALPAMTAVLFVVIVGGVTLVWDRGSDALAERRAGDIVQVALDEARATPQDRSRAALERSIGAAFLSPDSTQAVSALADQWHPASVAAIGVAQLGTDVEEDEAAELGSSRVDAILTSRLATAAGAPARVSVADAGPLAPSELDENSAQALRLMLGATTANSEETVVPQGMELRRIDVTPAGVQQPIISLAALSDGGNWWLVGVSR